VRNSGHRHGFIDLSVGSIAFCRKQVFAESREGVVLCSFFGKGEILELVQESTGGSPLMMTNSNDCEYYTTTSQSATTTEPQFGLESFLTQ
jgi:hypothetical protein